MFQNIELAELHATKTGHSKFSESSETVKPLTEGEKQAQLLRFFENNCSSKNNFKLIIYIEFIGKISTSFNFKLSE